MDKSERLEKWGKYADLIDDETWAFIDKTNNSYPEDAVEMSIEGQRNVYNEMCAQFAVRYPDGVVAIDSVVDAQNHTIPIRQYRLEGAEPRAQILYFHGGGFVVGGLESHDDVCAELCASTGFFVTSVDYRLSPEHIYPAAHNDSLAAYQFVSQGSLPTVLVGDSAGANLAASVAHVARELDKKPIGQVLIYPVLTHDLSSASYTDHANAPLLSTADIEFYHEVVTGGVDCSQDPKCAPLSDNDFSDLPSTYAFGAGCDPLLDDSRLYCEAINASGGEAHFYEEAGLVHGYLRARHSVKRAKESFERIVQACNSLANP
jgi:acetyl esterase